jgi:hypothetical protein
MISIALNGAISRSERWNGKKRETKERERERERERVRKGGKGRGREGEKAIGLSRNYFLPSS